jgi:hypothetical protein
VGSARTGQALTSGPARDEGLLVEEDPMHRLFAAVLAAIALLTAPAAVAAGAPNIYHSIKVTMASAAFVRAEGCLETQAWISATDGQWAAQGGGVTKAGDLAVSLRIVDTCAPLDLGAGVGPMAGGGGAILYDGFGRTPVPLGWSPRIASAWTGGTVTLVDQLSGATSVASVDVAWSGGPLSHETTANNHGKCAAGECLPQLPDFEVIVNTHDNNLRRAATATVEITMDGEPIAFEPSADAVIEQVKSACMEVPRGTFEGDTDYCF